MQFDPTLDLELTRFFTAPPAKVWRCFTDLDLFRQWWTPKPVKTTDVVMDLRPGGRFFTLMVLPDGTEMPNDGSFLEVIPAQKIAFTDLFMPDWQPNAAPDLGFAGIMTFAPEGSGTRYTACARHRNNKDRNIHSEMGFHDGWGTVADQLGALAAGL
ncbi:MAG: SRPBCC family protein [Paracoccaceae bacterium]